MLVQDETVLNLQGKGIVNKENDAFVIFPE